MGKTRNRPAACDECGFRGRFSFGPAQRVGLPRCACDGQFQWVSVEDLCRAGIVDSRSLPAEELRRLGWEDEIQRRPPGRKSKQRHCDNGCGRFVANTAERCGGGHWQQWAIERGLDRMSF
jgi:hypothetical protein